MQLGYLKISHRYLYLPALLWIIFTGVKSIQDKSSIALSIADTCCRSQFLFLRIYSQINQADAERRMQRQSFEIAFLRSRKKTKELPILSTWDLGTLFYWKNMALHSQKGLRVIHLTAFSPLTFRGSFFTKEPPLGAVRCAEDLRRVLYFCLSYLVSPYDLESSPLRPSFSVKFHLPSAVYFDWKLFRAGIIHFLSRESVFYQFVLYVKCLCCFSSNFH